MNMDKIKGAAKDAQGKLQRKAGEATGDTEQQAKGLAKQGEGKLQKGVGKARDALSDSSDDASSKRDTSTGKR